ncbi:MAG TPA: hypothetical protein VIU61_20455, partial [Kofleriaceae bacterium]
EIRNAPSEGASCVDEIFAPMPLVASSATEVGMADGPLLTMLALPQPLRVLNVPKIFETGNPAKLSSGHRMVSEQVAPLMGPLSQLYAARAQGAPVEATASAAQQLSANMPNNYSPTAFLVQAIADPAIRSVDYVVTLSFVDAAGYQKAKRLAQNPVP